MYIKTSFDFYDPQLWRQQSETWRFPPVHGETGNGEVLTPQSMLSSGDRSHILPCCGTSP